MEADDKENIVQGGYDPHLRVPQKMEGLDQNKCKSADVKSTSIQDSGLQALDLTTENKTSADVTNKKEGRWIKDPLVCQGDSEEDEEVFFGDVTNKEIKKTKKFSARKTAVFVPGFRMDRHLMRYTMCPQALNQLAETEKPPGKENTQNDTVDEMVPSIGKSNQHNICSLTEQKLDIEDKQKNDGDQSEVSVETLVDELKDIENDLNGIEIEPENSNEDVSSTLVPSELSEALEKKKLSITKEEMQSGRFPMSDAVCVEVGCIQNSCAESVTEYENLISEVINESLHEDYCAAPDCSLLLQEGATGNPASSHSYSVSSGDSTSDESDSEDEDSVNREIVNNMLRALDRRTAILSALAKMRQHPDNNPNTKGKPESFEKMLKASEDKHNQLVDNITGSEEESFDVKQKSPDDNLENPCGNVREELDKQFQRLEIQSEEVETNCCSSKVRYKEESFKNNSEILRLPSNKNSEETGYDGKDILTNAADEDDSQELVYSGFARKDEEYRESLHSGDAMSSCALVFSNRNNNNSNDGDLGLDQVSNKITQLSLDTLPEPNSSISILPDFPCNCGLATGTNVAQTPDIEELAIALPELDVDDVIDLLKEGPVSELFTPQRETGPQRDAGSTAIMADGNLMQHRMVGDNTVVVASNNYLGSLPCAVVHHNLPEFPTRIGATHTVASVRGPISSPGAVRCQRRYRSIYATLPNDSIEIETQDVHECSPSTDLMGSFGKLNIMEAPMLECPLNDSIITGTPVVLPVDTSLSHQEGCTLDASLSSPKSQSPHFQSKKSISLQNSRSPLPSDGCLAERPAELAISSQVQTIQSSPKLSPEAHGFSPSVVFTEKNFSPILKVHFPDSPSVEVPTGLKCTAHSLFPSKSTTTCSSYFVSREKKRKQPPGDDCLTTMVEPSVNLPKGLTKVKTTPTKGRTPPKKVIGSPTIHKFHTAFGKNPASRSLIHKFGIHVSPRPIGKAAHRTPGSNPRTRTKTPVSVRKLLLSTKPVVTSETSSNKTGVNAAKAKTLPHTNTPSSLKKKTPCSVKDLKVQLKVQSSTWVNGGPTKTQNGLQTSKRTPAKSRQTPNSAGSVQRSSTKKSVYATTTLSCDPVKPLIMRSTLPKQVHGMPDRTGIIMPTTQPQAFCRATLNNKPCATPHRMINGEANTSPMFSPGAKATVTVRSEPESRRTPVRSTKADDSDLTNGLGLSPPAFNIGKPAVFIKGTPRYLDEDCGKGSDVTADIFAEPPPVFELYDLPESPRKGDTGSREGSPRLSMEDVLERKRQQMITLRAEKRKIHDIKTRQGSPTVKLPRANNRVPHDPLPKQRLANTQTLTLSDKELDAVTQVHTLCNSQRTVKVIHKGRAMLIRQIPQSPHMPRRLSWNENLQVEIGEDKAQSTPSSPEGTTSPPKPILTMKDAWFVYPYDDESPAPVVVVRNRSGDRQQSTRSPRID